MRNRTPEALATPQVGGRLAVGIFVFTLLAFVTESQLTQYVQSNLGYRQPFFLFYLVHSSFAIIFPLHLLYILGTTNYTTVSLLRGLSFAITNHLSPGQKSAGFQFPRAKFIWLVLGCTLGITCPALLWFLAVSLASVSDVTAIWNTNAFFAYLISVKLFKLKWESRRLLAVVLATLGTIAVVYGGTTSPTEKKPATNGTSTTASFSFKPSAPLLGNLLTLVASFGYGLYQVLYKIYAALPSDPEVASDIVYEQIPDEDDNVNLPLSIDPESAVYPPPFGLHPNLLTSLLGFSTLVILWIPIPFLHWSGAEVFRLPPNFLTVMAISGIAFSGVVFNAGFMVLLGIWGPIIVSVGNLLTIVLVLISDLLFGAGLEVVTFWSLTGSGVIVLAFGVLAYDMFTKR
ncbi:hypothetical protein GALMADRAFT_233487 [Galerina marginata CBS 339.88]|uniref:EamA domain-containing protein n=1 Tax=Galerina marginata (strain CBS 339.88) TaxID=685588 RepID=A0A067TP56_GALM3|nr:hypothetical protein GALMADRAFT_233487 [Galerina marginata CBS 339.88]